MPLDIFQKKPSSGGDLSREKVAELIASGETSRSELTNYLNNNRAAQPPVPGYNGRGRLVQVQVEGGRMQKSTQGDCQTLSGAAQRENEAKDQAVTSPYLNSAAVTLDGVTQSLLNARGAVQLAYDQATPAQRQKLNAAERDLHHAYNAADRAKEKVLEVRQTYSQTLSKDGKSQYNAATRGDPRSLEVQIANQKRVPERDIRTISASPKEAKPSRTEANRGKAKRDLVSAVDGQGKTQSPVVHSQQVSNSRPEPEAKPTPELGGGVDAAAHLDSKSRDNQRSRAVSAAHQEFVQKVSTGLRQNTGQGKSHSPGQSQGIGR